SRWDCASGGTWASARTRPGRRSDSRRRAHQRRREGAKFWKYALFERFQNLQNSILRILSVRGLGTFLIFRPSALRDTCCGTRSFHRHRVDEVLRRWATRSRVLDLLLRKPIEIAEKVETGLNLIAVC